MIEETECLIDYNFHNFQDSQPAEDGAVTNLWQHADFILTMSQIESKVILPAYSTSELPNLYNKIKVKGKKGKFDLLFFALQIETPHQKGEF